MPPGRKLQEVIEFICPSGRKKPIVNIKRKWEYNIWEKGISQRTSEKHPHAVSPLSIIHTYCRPSLIFPLAFTTFLVSSTVGNDSPTFFKSHVDLNYFFLFFFNLFGHILWASLHLHGRWKGFLNHLNMHFN